MNNNELRIGNWVNHAGKECQVNLKLLTHTLNPIRLTPEIVLKCFFEPIGLPSNFNNGNVGYRYPLMLSANRWLLVFGNKNFIRSAWIYDNDNVYAGMPLSSQIDSLHKLQNLLHILIGAELNYIP